MRGWRIGMLAAAWLCFGSGLAGAAELRANMQQATPTGPGDAVGTVTISDGTGGATVKTALPSRPYGLQRVSGSSRWL